MALFDKHKVLPGISFSFSLLLSLILSIVSAFIFFLNSQHTKEVQPFTQSTASAVNSAINSAGNSTSGSVISKVVNVANSTTTEEDFVVTRVVDGDTIVVASLLQSSTGTSTEHVRLIGVDTPETVDPRKPVQCFGKEASHFLSSILTGQKVRLVADASQQNRDKYGRLLRYVYLGDTLINEEIIQAGYGHEYTYKIPYQFQKEFKASENYARSGELGLWASSTCS